MNPTSRSYTLLLAGASLWCFLLVAPALQVVRVPAIASAAGIINRCLASVCHQYDSRSFHLFGFAFAVCSRCTCVYFGFLAGVLLWRFYGVSAPRRALLWWCVAAAPMLIDVLADIAGIHGSDFVTRSVTGAWFGGIAAQIVTPLVIEACADVFFVSNHPQRSVHESPVR